MAALTDFLTYLDNKLTQVDNLEKSKNTTNNLLTDLNKRFEDFQTISEDVAKLNALIQEQKSALEAISKLIEDSQKNYEEFAKFVSDRLEKESALSLQR